MSDFPKVLLLATDGSADAALARRAAADLARRSGAALHVVHVWHTPALSAASSGAVLPDNYVDSFAEAAGETLDAEVGLLEEDGLSVAGRHLLEGRPASEIIRLADALDAGLIVMGSRGLGGVRRLIRGSVSEELVHHTHRPVLVMRGTDWPPGRIVIADDGSGRAEAAADMAAESGRLLGCEVVIIEVIPHFQDEVAMPGMSVETALNSVRGAVEDRAERLEGILGRAPQVRVVVDEPAVGILDVAEAEGKSSLIAMGARGAGAMGPLRIGSVSTKVLRASHGPVLITPSG